MLNVGLFQRCQFAYVAAPPTRPYRIALCVPQQARERTAGILVLVFECVILKTRNGWRMRLCLRRLEDSRASSRLNSKRIFLFRETTVRSEHDMYGSAQT
jgi:hypothetical protein